MAESQETPSPSPAAPPVVAALAITSGPTFAGKTTWLLGRIRRHIRNGKFVFVGKPGMDTRFDTNGIPAVHSHPGDAFPAVRLPTHESIFSGLTPRELDNFNAADFVAIDEAHMFQGPFLADFVHRALFDLGKEVALVGLDADSQGRPFNGWLSLLPFATEACKLVARCRICAASAPLTVRTTPLVNGNWVGGSEAYASLCLGH